MCSSCDYGRYPDAHCYDSENDAHAAEANAEANLPTPADSDGRL